MPSATSATDPFSDYEALSTLWAAARSTRGTDLRGKSLVNLDVLTPVPDGFVSELGSKQRPAGIEYGLGHAGSRQSTGIDVADANAPILAHEPRGQLMQEVLAAVRDLRVDGPHADLASGALRNGERPFVLSINAGFLDLRARRQRDQRLEAKIDTDLADPMVPVFWDIAYRSATMRVARPPSAAARASESAPSPRPEWRGSRRGEVR